MSAVGFKSADPEEDAKPRRKKVDTARVISRTLTNLLPGEAGVALAMTLVELGYTFTEETTIKKTPFGPQEIPFAHHTVTLDGEEVTIPWGTYSVDGLGLLLVDMYTHQMPPVPYLSLQVERKNTDTKKFDAIVKRVQEIGPTLTLFRGRALKLDSPMDLLIPNVIDTSKEVEMIFNRDIEDALQVNLFAPIEHREMLKAQGIRLRRGVILEGPYGVGKTLTAYKAARMALANKQTFLLAANHIAAIGIMTARAVQPSVLFIEDMDGAAHGDRDELDSLLNLMSGVDAKKEIDTIIILSTNFIDRIDPAFLRPERIDAIIEVRPPTGKTVERLLLKMCGEAAATGEPREWDDLLIEADGCSPAIIGEAVQRAKISALTSNGPVTIHSVRKMLRQMARQRDLSKPKFTEATNSQKLAKALYKVTRFGEV